MTKVTDKLDCLWGDVLCAPAYNSVIYNAQWWLQALWPHAYALGYAPKGKGYDPGLLGNCPRILIRQYPLSQLGEFDGANIYVTTYRQMRKLGSGVSPFARLRLTILHETQHALDDLRRLPIPPENPKNPDYHNGWFLRRLSKLIDAFPPL